MGDVCRTGTAVLRNRVFADRRERCSRAGIQVTSRFASPNICFPQRHRFSVSHYNRARVFHRSTSRQLVLSSAVPSHAHHAVEEVKARFFKVKPHVVLANCALPEPAAAALGIEPDLPAMRHIRGGERLGCPNVRIADHTPTTEQYTRLMSSDAISAALAPYSRKERAFSAELQS